MVNTTLMLICISPAKRLDVRAPRVEGGTVPHFQSEAERLAESARALTAPALEQLMHISPKLAALTLGRFAAFGSGEGAKAAIELFDGDTYTGLDAGSLDADEIDYAQRHLRVLSGLYGVLRPRDVIEPHRLEMGSRLANPRGKNLYEFWGNLVAERLNAEARAVGARVLVNCASVEYFSVADRPALTLQVITPVFLDDGPKGPRVISFWAKQARGAMARFIVRHRLTDPGALKAFDAGGYRFEPAMSEGDRLVFLRSAG